MNYQRKYIKYKNKYLNITEQRGGAYCLNVIDHSMITLIDEIKKYDNIVNGKLYYVKYKNKQYIYKEFDEANINVFINEMLCYNEEYIKLIRIPTIKSPIVIVRKDVGKMKKISGYLMNIFNYKKMFSLNTILGSIKLDSTNFLTIITNILLNYDIMLKNDIMPNILSRNILVNNFGEVNFFELDNIISNTSLTDFNKDKILYSLETIFYGIDNNNLTNSLEFKLFFKKEYQNYKLTDYVKNNSLDDIIENLRELINLKINNELYKNYLENLSLSTSTQLPSIHISELNPIDIFDTYTRINIVGLNQIADCIVGNKPHHFSIGIRDDNNTNNCINNMCLLYSIYHLTVAKPYMLKNFIDFLNSLVNKNLITTDRIYTNFVDTTIPELVPLLLNFQNILFVCIIGDATYALTFVDRNSEYNYLLDDGVKSQYFSMPIQNLKNAPWENDILKVVVGVRSYKEENIVLNENTFNKLTRIEQDEHKINHYIALIINRKIKNIDIIDSFHFRNNKNVPFQIQDRSNDVYVRKIVNDILNLK
jgi:hypothetical protein